MWPGKPIEKMIVKNGRPTNQKKSRSVTRFYDLCTSSMKRLEEESVNVSLLTVIEKHITSIDVNLKSHYILDQNLSSLYK